MAKNGKKPVKEIKLQIPAGKASPAPPVGPALGAAGINIMGFCKEFNAKTQDQTDVLPVVISVYKDKSFSFITKKPPVAEMIKKKANLQKGSSVPNRDKVGKLTKKDLEEILEAKKSDLRLKHGQEELGLHIIAGTARSMGVDIDWGE